ncbi:plasminogen-like [Amphiura filiformis]|uniref:plasminogen-like n=1 Tax=Amphiura filiformis TaxID=82378 RepID=UPI003B2193EA
MSILILLLCLTFADKYKLTLSQYCNGNFDFLCDNGACIYSGFQCDGENDCQDMTDEQNCDPECFTNTFEALNYRGSVSFTRNNQTCQKWTSHTPHSHQHITPGLYPEAGLGDHNYCRNPFDDPNGPWCYTTDPDVRYEYCDVGEPSTVCNYADPECYTGTFKALDYRGSVSVTRNDRPCQNGHLIHLIPTTTSHLLCIRTLDSVTITIAATPMA